MCQGQKPIPNHTHAKLAQVSPKLLSQVLNKSVAAIQILLPQPALHHAGSHIMRYYSGVLCFARYLLIFNSLHLDIGEGFCL